METVEGGHARLIPKASGEEGRYIEIEGTANIVVECISDASIQKDCQRLRERYHRAGVREYWLVDARGETVDFQVLLFRTAEYQPASPDAEGFLKSEVLGARVRLMRRRRQAGLVVYRLELR